MTGLQQTSTVRTARKPLVVVHSERLEIAGASADLAKAALLNCGFAKLVNAGGASNAQTLTALTEQFFPSAWLLTMAGLFNRFRFRRCSLEWVPRCGTGDRGNIVVSHLADASDAITTTENADAASVVDPSMAELEACGTRSVSFPVWQRQVIDLPLSGNSGYIESNVVLNSKVTDDINVPRYAEFSAKVRQCLPDGVFLAKAEGVNLLAGAAGTAWSDIGHWRATYHVELHDPVTPAVQSNLDTGIGTNATRQADTTSLAAPQGAPKQPQVDLLSPSPIGKPQALYLSWREGEDLEWEFDTPVPGTRMACVPKLVEVGVTRVKVSFLATPERAGADRFLLLAPGSAHFEGAAGIPFGCGWILEPQVGRPLKVILDFEIRLDSEANGSLETVIYLVPVEE